MIGILFAGADRRPAVTGRSSVEEAGLYSRCVAGLRRLLPAGFVVLALAACEGGGDPVASARPGTGLSTVSGAPTRSEEPESSASRTPLVTATLPTRSAVALPTPNPPTQNPTTQNPPPQPTESRPAPPPTQTADAPTQTSTPTPSRAAPSTPAAAPAPASGSTPPSTPAATSVYSSTSPWVWWLLGLLIAGAAIAFIVVAVRRGRTRKAWSARRAGVLAESTWLAHGLVPHTLSVQSPAARRDVWTASRPRVDTLGRSLSELVASAPQDQVGSLDRLRDAVAGLRAAMDAYAVTDAGDPERLGAARQAQWQLEEALHAAQPPPGPGAAQPPHGPGAV